MEQYPFQGLRISSILRDLSIVGTRQMQCRRSHGFIIKLRGATEYCAGEQVWLLEAGQILFVPKGSSYFIREVEPGYSYVVNFDCTQSCPMCRLPTLYGSGGMRGDKPSADPLGHGHHASSRKALQQLAQG